MKRISSLLLIALFLAFVIPAVAEPLSDNQLNAKTYMQGIYDDVPLDPPFAEVWMYTYGGSKIAYFALEPETIAGFGDDDLIVDDELKKKIGGIGIRYTLGEKDEYGKYLYYDSTPESLLQLAELKAGYQKADMRVKSEKLLLAHLDLRGDFHKNPYTVAEQTITDTEQLKKLQEILQNASYGMMGDCAHYAVLTLVFEDGTTARMYKATDDCDGILAGSYTPLVLGDKGNERFWTLFADVRAATEAGKD